MELNNKEREDLFLQIKRDFPNFEEQELLEFSRIIIPNIHFFFSHERNEKLSKYCSKQLIQKVLQDRVKYRITRDIDNTRVGYARIQEYIKENNKCYIKVYTSVFFYDEAANNIENSDSYDKYWNDIWTITYKGNFDKEITNKCPTCGASMEYNHSKHMFTCNYCRNSLYYSQINWQIVDIEVNGIEYK